MDILRGTQVPVKFKIQKAPSGDLLTPTELDDVEITIGRKLRKTYLTGGIVYDTSVAAEPRWVATITQTETYSLDNKQYPMIFRIKFKGSSQWVFGKQFDTAFVSDNNTEVIL